jgi:hypothetical protein
MKLDRYKTHDIEIVVDRSDRKTPDNETLSASSWRKLVSGSDSQEVRYFSRNVPYYWYIVSKSRPNFPSTLQKEPVIIAKDWER